MLNLNSVLEQAVLAGVQQELLTPVIDGGSVNI